MAIDIELDMTVDPENEVTMSVDDGDEVSFDVGEAIVIKDHAILDNRDLPDQHPISAITGLEDALANIDNMLVVNITSSGSGYVADKTYAEIVEAIPNVVALYSGSYYPFYRNEPTVNPKVTFHGMLLGGEDNTMVVEREIYVHQRDSVGVNTIARPIPYLTSELTNDSGYITEDNVPKELFVVIFFLTGQDPLTVATTTTAYEIAQAVQSGKALYAVLVVGGGFAFANLTPTTLISDNGDVSVGFAFNEQGSNIMGIRYFEIHMSNDGSPNVTNIKTDPFLTEITSSNVTSALGYTPVNPTTLTNYMQKGIDYVTAGQMSGTTLGNKATAEGNNTQAKANYAHAEGNQTTATGIASHAEGFGTIASSSNSHAEGSNSKASNSYAHAEGSNNTASGESSHAEGDTTTASGRRSHAENYNTTASGPASHAEGDTTQASGWYTHAEGSHTSATRKSQHTFGEYNIAETGSISSRGTYVEIVGNGTADNARSNARTLDWSGNEWLAGKLTVGADPTANMEVATKQYVDNSVVTPPVTSVNGRTGAVTGLAEASAIPTKTSELTNDSGFVTHDNQVEQSYISNPSSYSYWRGLAIGANAVASESGALASTTDKVYVADAIRVQPSTGTIKATTFKGNLTGTASGNLVASDLVAITTSEIDALFV